MQFLNFSDLLYFARINFHEKFDFFRLKTFNLTEKTLKTLNFNKYSEWSPWKVYLVSLRQFSNLFFASHYWQLILNCPHSPDITRTNHMEIHFLHPFSTNITSITTCFTRNTSGVWALRSSGLQPIWDCSNWIYEELLFWWFQCQCKSRGQRQRGSA